MYGIFYLLDELHSFVVLLTLNPVTVKVKLSLYRPRYALKAPEV
jgi:hypothetical protein